MKIGINDANWVVVDRKEFDKFMDELPIVLQLSVEQSAREVISGAKKEYEKIVEKNLTNGHTKNKESIASLKTEESIGKSSSSFVLTQPSRAGRMMEFDKKDTGGFKAGNDRLLFRGMNNRVTKYLNAINFPQGEVMKLSDSKISGTHPFKPMRQTFDNYVIPEIQKQAYKNLFENVSKKLNAHKK